MCKYRMYSLVLRQLSPIQKGIQSAHSIVEYTKKHHKLSECIQWVSVDKTIIMLDGGTYQDLKECRDTLCELKVPHTIFFEDDLGGLMTSISFIVDEKVFDTKQYPSFDEEIPEESSESDWPDWLINMGGLRNLKLRNFIFSKKLSA